jgi:hypothetical protein
VCKKLVLSVIIQLGVDESSPFFMLQNLWGYDPILKKDDQILLGYYPTAKQIPAILSAQ